MSEVVVTDAITGAVTRCDATDLAVTLRAMFARHAEVHVACEVIQRQWLSGQPVNALEAFLCVRVDEVPS